MPSYSEPARPLEFLLWEEDNLYSREEVTLTASQGELKPGTVMAKVTATGNYVPYDDDANAGVPGSGIAAGVLAYGAPNVAATQKVVIIARQAIVKTASLVWEASNDGTEQTAGLADLAALGILAR